MFANSIILGNTMAPSNNAATLAHTTNGSGTPTIYSAFGIVGPGKTLDKIRIYCTAASALDSLVCEIRPEKSTGGVGINGTALATVTKTTGLPTGAGWVEFSGFNLALSAGTQYFAVFYNNSSGAAPSITYQLATYMQTTELAGQSTAQGFCKVHGVDGNTFATSANAGVTGLSFIYADGSRQGVPIQVMGGGLSSGFYSGVECGARFTVRKNCILNMAAAYFLTTTKNASPTGNVTVKLYDNTTLIFQSATVTTADLLSSRSVFAPCSIKLLPGNTYRLVLANSGGNSSNYNKLFYHQLDTANTPYFSPMLEAFQLTQGAGSSWTDTAHMIPTCGIILHPDTPFLPAPLNRRKFNSMR